MSARRLPRGVCRINAAKTECDHGHPFNEQNTYRYIDRCGRVHRFCRPCHNRVNRNSRRRIK